MQAFHRWLWFIYYPQTPIYIPLHRMLLYDRRPDAAGKAEGRSKGE